MFFPYVFCKSGDDRISKPSFILYSYNFVSYFYERNCCSSTSSNHNILHSYHALQINKFIFPVFKFPITFTSVALLNHFSSLLKHLVFLSPHSPPLIPSVALRRELGRYSHLEMSKPKLREMKKLAGGWCHRLQLSLCLQS